MLRIATLERRTVGRPYERLAINPDRGRIVDVDRCRRDLCRRDSIRLALAPLSHSTVTLDEHPTGHASVVEAAVKAGAGGRDPILGVGVSLPGQVSPDTGISIFAPNWDWHDVHIQELLEHRLQLPVYVDNGLKAITLSEMWYGVGRVAESMAVVNLGTGVGAGFAIAGTLIRGTGNNAGEWGHTLLQLDGRPCRCGRRGCVEAYLGVLGLETTLTEIDPTHAALRHPQQRDFIEAIGKGLTPSDPAIVELAARTSHYLAAALADLVNLLDIPNITLTGWTSTVLAEWLIPAVRQELPAHILPGARPHLTIEATRVPGNPVALGMAAFALERFLGKLGLASPASTPTTYSGSPE